MTVVLSAVFGVFAMMGLTACGGGDDGDPNYAQNFYAMSAISSLNYLQKNANTQISNASQVQRPTGMQEGDSQNIAGYLGMFQDMLASETTDYYTNGEVSADDQYAGIYNFKMTLSVPSLNGQQQSFSMYYNEVYTSTEEEIDDNELELEIDTTLEGIIVSGDLIYNVVGQREYEQEGNESEISIEFRAYINDTNYILIEHEMEDNEIEYQYTIFQNGQRSVTEVEFENERNRKQLELEFVNNSQSSQSRMKYEITQLANSDNVFNVRVLSAVDDVATGDAFTITVTNEGYIFSYADGSSEVIPN